MLPPWARQISRTMARPRPLPSTSPWPRIAVEAVEDVLALGLRNAGPLVTDADQGFPLPARHRRRDLGVGRAVADRVVDQVGDHLAQHRRVALFEHGGLRPCLESQVDALVQRQRHQLHGDFADQGVEVDRRAFVHIRPLTASACDIASIWLAKPAGAADAVQQAGEGAQHFLRVVLAQAVFGLGSEHRQRRPDLVGGVGEEALARGEHCRQALGVVVDGVDQRPDFAGHVVGAGTGVRSSSLRRRMVSRSSSSGRKALLRAMTMSRAPTASSSSLPAQAVDEQVACQPVCANRWFRQR